ncbi:MAG: CDP-alcohol phosphatidyltransferase family protein [Micrococcaceae bacterium]
MQLVGTGKNKAGIIVPTLFTWANLVTMCRFLLVPYFAWVVLHQHAYMKAFWILVILGSTDWIDGFIARRFNQVSTWGKILDPLVDRLGLALITLTMVKEGIAPWWLFPVLIVPDVTIALFGLLFLKRRPDFEVTYTGKIRTALLFFAVPFLLLSATPEFDHSWLVPFAKTLIIAGCIGHWIAGIQYMQQSIDQYKHKQVLASAIHHHEGKF